MYPHTLSDGQQSPCKGSTVLFMATNEEVKWALNYTVVFVYPTPCYNSSRIQ